MVCSAGATFAKPYFPKGTSTSLASFLSNCRSSSAPPRSSLHRRVIRCGNRSKRFVVEHRRWLDDYALFMSLRDANRGRHWSAWPAELVCREPSALRRARRELAPVIQTHQFMQFVFDRQLRTLRAHAQRAGIRFFGDLPIFVSDDSADVWANPHLFQLDKDRRPKLVSGVPPDIFSQSGQRWGNPLYDWDEMEKEGFAWWIKRFRSATAQAELVRIDHFRGFAACWAIPASRPDARVGRWLKAPGKQLLTAFAKR